MLVCWSFLLGRGRSSSNPWLVLYILICLIYTFYRLFHGAVVIGVGKNVKKEEAIFFQSTQLCSLTRYLNDFQSYYIFWLHQCTNTHDISLCTTLLTTVLLSVLDFVYCDCVSYTTGVHWLQLGTPW